MKNCNSIGHAGRVICGSCGKVFGRKVWNSPDERLRRIIWRCNGKYQRKAKRAAIVNISMMGFYTKFINTFNTLFENKDYFIAKWKNR